MAQLNWTYCNFKRGDGPDIWTSLDNIDEENQEHPYNHVQANIAHWKRSQEC